MRKQRIGLIILCTITLLFSDRYLSAQGDRMIRINEFLVFNDSNYVDDFGCHTAWIELFNPAYNPVNIAKMYITDDPANTTKYRIPDAGNTTVLNPRSYVVFFADNKPTRGVFHLNFTLSETGYIGIYDSDGKTMMDEIHYPKQTTDLTYGRKTDGGVEWVFLEKSTPNSSNVTVISETSAEMFGRLDPWGVGLTVISMSVVFGSLILLYYMYSFVGYLNQKKLKIPVKNANTHKKQDQPNSVVLSGEVNVAIAMALSQYVAQTHDFENTTITIKKISRPYSPWSSKIYGLRNNLGRK
jgi:Na+-transporting methylmalonyl-CoA/oxaloacetate decarboxylase gamma subunit